jgi:hypothetical protein
LFADLNITNSTPDFLRFLTLVTLFALHLPLISAFLCSLILELVAKESKKQALLSGRTLIENLKNSAISWMMILFYSFQNYFFPTP